MSSGGHQLSLCLPSTGRDWWRGICHEKTQERLHLIRSAKVIIFLGFHLRPGTMRIINECFPKRNQIRRDYYYQCSSEENDPARRFRASPRVSPRASPRASSRASRPGPDHERKDCEACEVLRCPIPGRAAGRRPRVSLSGGEQYLEYLDWVLLDENNHAFPLNPFFYNYI